MRLASVVFPQLGAPIKPILRLRLLDNSLLSHLKKRTIGIVV